MTRLRHEILLQRFRHTLVSSGAIPAEATDDELLNMARGNTYDEKLTAIEAVLALYPPDFFECRGL